MKKFKQHKLNIKYQTIRDLTTVELGIPNGGFSNPANSCDSCATCTTCTIKPP